jgi:hypothetical protein
MRSLGGFLLKVGDPLERLTNVEAAQLLWDIGGADRVLLDPAQNPEKVRA